MPTTNRHPGIKCATQLERKKRKENVRIIAVYDTNQIPALQS